MRTDIFNTLSTALTGKLSVDEIKDLAEELSLLTAVKLNTFMVYYYGDGEKSELIHSQNEITAWREFNQKYPERIITKVLEVN